MNDPQALEKRVRREPKSRNSSTVADQALDDANREAVKYLQDVAVMVPYSHFARKGMTFQNFARTRRIAFQDEFEDVSDEVKQAGLNDQVDLFEIRMQPEYVEMRRLFREAIVSVDMPATSKDFLKRVGGKAWMMIERSLRSDDPMIARDALRVASDILQIEQPKASRANAPQVTVNLPDGMMKAIAAAFVEAGEELPGAKRIREDAVDVEATVPIDEEE